MFEFMYLIIKILFNEFLMMKVDIFYKYFVLMVVIVCFVYLFNVNLYYFYCINLEDE